MKTAYLFAKVCLNKMLVHALFACRARAQCLDYARNNVWSAIILEAVRGMIRGGCKLVICYAMA